MRDANFDADTLRIFLHVFGVTIWLGGQIVMLSLLPVLRKAEVEGLPARAARAFQRVAWPAYGLAFVTGMWNIFAVDMSDTTTAYSVVFGIKFLLVILSGVAAYAHATTKNVAVKGITGAIAFGSALGAMILGYALN